jgi:acyl-CoA synthetase (AMP-forming)/AMP-acid ligase II
MPKAVRHTWASLARPVRATGDEKASRWLLCYPPHLYAGLQVFLQCVINGGVLVIDDSRGDVRALIELMVKQSVGHISATPSYWRRIFMLADPTELARVPMVQITLGGEVVDDGVLSKLAQVFPQARIVHIYATSELGRCFSVTDRMSGFPAKFLNQRSTDGVELRIEDGELLVRSENRMADYDSLTPDGVQVSQDGWTRTGDLVELRGDRVHFVGRMTDIINVGGNKVAPLDVERVIRSVPGVLDVRVYPKGSSIAGQLVACDVVLQSDIDPNDLRRRITQQCQSALAGHARPRWITIVDQIALTAAHKVRRSEAAE